MNIDHEFPQQPELCYLNHAAVAPWPQRTLEAVTRFAQENVLMGATHYPRWLETERRLRKRLAKLINANGPNDIALAKNTSEALSIVAYGIQWSTGDEVIISNEEFPSNRIVWESLNTKGVKTRIVDIKQTNPEQAILDAITPKTKLVSISSVQYASGRRIDLTLLGNALNRRNILFCIDAIQSLGAIPFDCQACCADIVVADGHKWMLGPEGIALLYVRPSLRRTLQLNQFGWHMVKNRGDYDRQDWEVADDATCFECGSPNMLGIHALEASLSLLEALGMDQVFDQLQKNISKLIAQLKDLPGVYLISPEHPERRAGIVTFGVQGFDATHLQRQLMENHVICAARGGGVRLSPHFYTNETTITRAVEQLRKIISPAKN